MATASDFLTQRAGRLQSALDAFLQESSGSLDAAADALAAAVREGRTVFVCGNGGSAAHAMHFEAELLGRFRRDRDPLPSLFLGASVSSLTAIANDYGVDAVFARPLAGLAKPGDALVALSTSGTSPNILAALDVARDRGLATVLLAGQGADPAAADHVLRFEGGSADQVQEAHQLAIHAVIEAIEAACGL